MCIRLKAYALEKISGGQGAGIRAAGKWCLCATRGRSLEIAFVERYTAYGYSSTKPSNKIGPGHGSALIRPGCV